MSIDPKTNNQIIIDHVHYKIHDSQMYSATYSNTIASGGTGEIYIKTSTGEPHTVFYVACSGAAKARLLEGITTTVNGTAIGIYNMHRESTDSGTVLVYHTPTWSTNTEITLAADYVGSASNPGQPIGSQARLNSEWILKPDEKYLVQIVNQAGATITTILNIEFYELSV